ncbi:hypothetical protein CJ030_MR7G007505 [Morella rubra]|uniref:Uncharacterized protein n=1 Tax=Morella rubra TaxID=262757 RepID=A0A6A1V6S1_9ROSI|nr:hypothetical protein CJ030_MR7G007505 [Morella rubra]
MLMRTEISLQYPTQDQHIVVDCVLFAKEFPATPKPVDQIHTTTLQHVDPIAQERL